MSVIAPNSSIYFLNVPFGKDYKHVTDGSLAGYLASPVKVYTNQTYIRRDSNNKPYIAVDCVADDLLTANYIVYKNASYKDKFIYAFIDHVEYKNDSVSWVYFHTDVYQTFKNDITINPCFIVREHVSDDTIGLHTVDESIDPGEFVRSTAITNAGLGTTDIIIATSLESDGATPVFGDIYSGVFSGVKYYGSSNPAAIVRFIDAFNDAGKSAGIVAIFMVPHKISGCSFGIDVDELSPADLATFYSVTGPARPETINGYVPKNNKLFCYPYTFLYAHNNSGGAAVFRWEFFNGTPAFKLFGPVSPSPVYKLIPSNLLGYPASGNDYDSGLTIAGYPICPWSSDVYKNWIAQNAGSIAAGTAAAAITIGIGIATAGAGAATAAAAVTASKIASVGAIASGSSLLLNQIGNQSEKKAQPPQAQGQLNSGSANISVGMNDFFIYGKSILAEYAEIIDDYFSMYGYKINRVKSPNLTGREQWNYVQTIDCHITGDIPETDKQELETIFNKGVTIWHTPANIGNYSLSNGVNV